MDCIVQGVAKSQTQLSNFHKKLLCQCFSFKRLLEQEVMARARFLYINHLYFLLGWDDERMGTRASYEQGLFIEKQISYPSLLPFSLFILGKESLGILPNAF